MAATETAESMTDEGRALMTETERRIIAGEKDVSDNYRYKVESLVRNRVRKKLGDDVDVLHRDFPEVFEMVESEVCGSVDELDRAREAYRDLVAAREDVDTDGIEAALAELGAALDVEEPEGSDV